MVMAYFQYMAWDIPRAVKLSGDLSVKDATKAAGLTGTLSAPLNVLLSNLLVEQQWGASYDDISTQLYECRKEFWGVEQAFPGGYIQIVDGYEYLYLSK